MKKIISLFLKSLLLITAFFSAVWFFVPWRQVGETILTVASEQLQKSGMKISYSGVEAVDGGFKVNDITLSGLLRFSFQSVTLKPDLLSSAMTFAMVSSVSFSDGKMMMGQLVDIGSGGVLVIATPKSVLLEKLNSDGDFSINGYVAINPAQMRISRAEALVKVPEALKENMTSLQMLLPLVQEGDGRWFLRRSEEKPAK